MKPPVNPVRLEELGLSAWPALEETHYDGWILRFADGHTKRANSISPLYPSTIDVEEKIAACERAHEEHGLPTIFRLTPFSEPATLDQTLDSRDYSMIDRTLVMTRSIANFSAPPSDFSIRPVDAETWLDTFERFDLLSPEDMSTRRGIIGRISPDPIPVIAGPADHPTGINLGVREGAAVGLFSLFVAEERRLQGLGQALVEETLAIAADRGATLAYLQVEELNMPARGLYEKLGFTEAYPYWYRVRSE
ncbi:MAG: GNAT family N-acetyltransferase [Candidatus Bipolaricaulia bacterium]